MEPTLLPLGKLMLVGEAMRFIEEEPEHQADGRAPIELIVRYDYREVSHEKDEVRIVVTAELEGKPIGAAEHEISDRPLVGDDELGYLSIPVLGVGRGTFRGKFRAEATYARGEWDGDETKRVRFVKQGAFRLVIS